MSYSFASVGVTVMKRRLSPTEPSAIAGTTLPLKRDLSSADVVLPGFAQAASGPRSGFSMLASGLQGTGYDQRTPPSSKGSDAPIAAPDAIVSLEKENKKKEEYEKEHKKRKVKNPWMKSRQ